ncbi:MAG TPA: OPT family oligopeptide transporter [Kofleriaceae bacterium]|nr:OPT family oligopeptide transporter [Kofleriaceae bacterium]
MSTEIPRATVTQPMAEDPEVAWLRDVYQPNAPNLTVRAVIVGMLIGGLMCVSNLYVFFKTGWSMGVTLTACILAFLVFQALRPLGVKPLTVLENNALTTVASGAGYMTGGGNMAAYGALVMVIATAPQLMLTVPSPTPMIAWFGVIAALGVFVAIPIKRQLINREGLAFPTGTATAETLRAIHEAAHTTKQPGLGKASWLLIGMAIGGVLAWVRDAFALLPGAVAAFGATAAKWTFSLKTEVILLGAGALMSFRTGWSLLLGGIATYVVMGPILAAQGLIVVKGASYYKAVVSWTLWPGAAILVGAGLTSFVLDWRSLRRSFQGIGQIFSGTKRGETGIAAVEAPDWWFPIALLVLSPVVIFLMVTLFDIPVWAALLAVPLAVLMGFIAARVTGETDVTPTKALGPVTQMIYGVVTPGNITGNIMSANVTGGIGLHSADLLTTLKTGWLLGAKPRHQLYAQLFGVVAGAAVVVPAFLLIIPQPSPEQLAAGITTVLGTEDWPAPSCLVWAGVSEAFSNGIGGMHASVKWAIVIGLAIGIALTLWEKAAPKTVKPYIPSANGLGISMVIPGSNAVAMFVGSAIAEIMRRRGHEGVVVPVASGLIAGESLIGVLVVMLTTIVGLNFAL